MSNDPTGALTLKAFCRDYGLSKAQAKKEISAHRLSVRVLGPRSTIVERAEAERWLRTLPARCGS